MDFTGATDTNKLLADSFGSETLPGNADSTPPYNLPDSEGFPGALETSLPSIGSDSLGADSSDDSLQLLQPASL